MSRIVEGSEIRAKNYQTAIYPEDEPSIRYRIHHVLSIWPRLNHTMLQVGLGTGFSPRLWRPVLSKMIQEGLIAVDEEMRAGPTGRYNMYVSLFLTETGKNLGKVDGD